MGADRWVAVIQVWKDFVTLLRAYPLYVSHTLLP